MSEQNILREAAGLVPYEPGVHPEYQRGIAELTNRLLGRTADEIEQTKTEILEEQNGH